MCGNDAPPFPSMHVAHAAIAMWFCRRWTRISKLLLIYNVVLVPVILLLEWHYLVDILGGILVAIAAKLITHVRVIDNADDRRGRMQAEVIA